MVTSSVRLEIPESLNLGCYSDLDGGRYRIRTCDFHRVNLTRLGFTTTYKTAGTA
jgi:hypothetical protein